MTATKATTRAISAAALVLAAVALVASPAQASAFRYWTYWQAPAGATAWAFATQGPGTSLPADGDVEGWSFGVTTESGNLDDAPRTAPDFATICGASTAGQGSKRVALVIDTGESAIAPAGQAPPASTAVCAVVPQDATGYDILRSVVEVRVENGLVCGIDGYPTGECAPVLDDVEAESLLAAAADAPSAEPVTTEADTVSAPAADVGSAPTSGSGTPLATLAVGVLLLGGAAFWYLRGRRGR
jgi:hypothetical protein